MIKMIINDDDNNYNDANEGNGDQKMKIFQIMHFREPLTSEKPKFLALAHVYLYSYWCCQVTVLLAYNGFVTFWWHSYRSIMSGYNVISL